MIGDQIILRGKMIEAPAPTELQPRSDGRRRMAHHVHGGKPVALPEPAEHQVGADHLDHPRRPQQRACENFPRRLTGPYLRVVK
jgi:hypothetical protein